MKKIVYYMLCLTLKSPLAISSGVGESTDKDIIVDKRGKPFIPASSIAGVIRSRFSADTANSVFGFIDKASGNSSESCIRFYDALLTKDSPDYYIAVRDCVALSEKTAIDGAKFDFEVIEPGAEFTGYIELCKEYVAGEADSKEDAVEVLLKDALSAINSGELRFGAKTTRGYGRVSLKVCRKAFSLPEQLDEWLSFDMFRDFCDPVDFDVPKHGNLSNISISLRNKAGVSVREYTTDVSSENETMPDYRQMALHDNSETPVIPGTSWAGAFRERFSQFAGNKATDELFGYVKKDSNDAGKSVACKSDIVFSESQLEHGEWKIYTRNSIDRFSSATKNQALYSERTYFGGTTTLEISLSRSILERYITPLSCVLLDLHHGYLAVGGLVSVGRGLFEIEKLLIDGIDVTKAVIADSRILTVADIKECGGDINAVSD